MDVPHERLDAHFSLIQAVISRQASNSFVAKGWALTASFALYGFAIEKDRTGLALLGILAVGIFWVLDAYFLRQERLFRCLYQSAIAEDGSVPLYSMDTSGYRGQAQAGLASCVFSITLTLFYGTLVSAGLAVVVLTLCSPC